MLSTSLLGLLLLFSKDTTAVPTKCCGSKTVGSHSYSLVDTNAAVPETCKNNCAYSRDDDEGSLFCFADGTEVVECSGEMDVPICFPGPHGGCPPVKDVKIGGPWAIPNTVVEKATYEECWDWCMFLCNESFSSINETCQCESWTWQASNNTCYTYPWNCWTAILEEGFWSGGVCKKAKIEKPYTTEDIEKHLNYVYSPLYGGLNIANKYFNDHKVNPNGENKVTEIEVFTGPYYGRIAVVGIRLTYDVSTGPLYGNVGTGSTKLTTPDGVAFSGVFGQAVSMQGTHSLVYRIGFYRNDGTQAGPVGGNHGSDFQFNAPYNFKMWFVDGDVTRDPPYSPSILGRVGFAFRK